MSLSTYCLKEPMKQPSRQYFQKVPALQNWSLPHSISEVLTGCGTGLKEKPMVKGSVVPLTLLVNFDHCFKDNWELFGANFQQTSNPTLTTVFMKRQMEEN